MNGLTNKEVIQNRNKYGSNTLTKVKKKTLFSLILESLGDPIIKILIIVLVFKIVFLFKNNDWFETIGIVIAIILAFVDLNSFGACFSGELQNGAFTLNLIVTVMMIIQAIATVFSGYDYMKDMKNLLK